MSNVRTVTIDLDEVKELARKVAQDNMGLETSSGLNVEDFDRALDVLVQGDPTRSLITLLREIVEIHYDAHNEFK